MIAHRRRRRGPGPLAGPAQKVYESGPGRGDARAMYKIVGAILVAALVVDFIWVIRTALSVQ
jgi:hypothetical protein